MGLVGYHINLHVPIMFYFTILVGVLSLVCSWTFYWWSCYTHWIKTNFLPSLAIGSLILFLALIILFCLLWLGSVFKIVVPLFWLYPKLELHLGIARQTFKLLMLYYWPDVEDKKKPVNEIILLETRWVWWVLRNLKTKRAKTW